MLLIIKIVGKYIHSALSLLLILITTLIFPNYFQAQVNKNGLPLIRNYSAEEYNAHSQNWSIIKDKRGVMYFGNNFGLLEYNGAKWEVFDNPNSAALYSLAVDDSGQIYYGADGDFGMMVPDSIGELDFFSIYKVYNSGDADFNAIRGVHVTKNHILYRSPEKIFVCKIPIDTKNKDQIKQNILELVPETSFHKSFTVGNDFYVKEIGKGLLKFKDDKLELIKGSEIFANERIYLMLAYGENKILIGCRESGLYIYDPETEENPFKEFKCDANDLIIESSIYDGVNLPGDRFAITTLYNGVIVINSQGEIIEHLTFEHGINDPTVLSVYYDDLSSNLWFSTNESGIYKAALGNPFREWNRANGLYGVVSDIIRFENKIYVSTSYGVFFLDENEEGFSTFKPLDKLKNESWDLEVFKRMNGEEVLLVGTNIGIYEVKGNNVKLIMDDGFVYKITNSSLDHNRIYIGFTDGFGAMEYSQSAKKWKFLGRNNAVTNTIKSILETESEKLYLSTDVSGIIRLANFKDTIPLYIDSALGLKIDGADFRVNRIDDDIIISSFSGLYKFDEEKNRAIPYAKFGAEYAEKQYGVYSITKSDNAYWMSVYSNDRKKNKWEGIVRIFKNEKDSFITDMAFSKCIPQKTSFAMYDDNQYMWIANDKGLYKFDKSVKKDYLRAYNINIFSVTTGEDSVLFAGTFYEEKDSIVYISLTQNDHLKVELSYRNNNITFEYAALYFDHEESTEYSYRLMGSSNESWSRWTKENKFPFTNLYEGDYSFEVRAKNIYGAISDTVKYEFTVLPPWYRTTWALILFGLAIIGLVWLIVRLNIRRLKLDKERLEKIVKERTAEIRLKNVELEQQKEEIMAQRDEIEEQRDYVIKQKDQITEQHDKIVEQQRNIMASIQYASRIQEAVLPPGKLLEELLEEHFVLFKPRDIVSGDFYWATRKNNKAIIVAADCTGHGVPGAFMSMLGVSFLNEIVNKLDTMHANIILNELRKNVKNSLRQTGKENEAKDGMDLALCVIDYDNMKLEYAGAYNSLYLIRDNELIKFQADRMPIGIYIKEKESFTNNIVDLRKGDNFYIFSDGYVDQFGGNGGSKIMSKRFKQLLLDNHTKPASKQKAALDKFLIDWQSHLDENGETYHQVDDILVIGMKI